MKKNTQIESNEDRIADTSMVVKKRIISSLRSSRHGFNSYKALKNCFFSIDNFHLLSTIFAFSAIVKKVKMLRLFIAMVAKLI